MKNPFVVSSLVLAIGSLTAVAASSSGLVSSIVPGLSTFIGFYAATGILAFALGDYLRQPASRAT